MLTQFHYRDRMASYYGAQWAGERKTAARVAKVSSMERTKCLACGGSGLNPPHEGWPGLLVAVAYECQKCEGKGDE